MMLQGVHNCTVQGEGDERQYYLAPSARVFFTQNAVKAQVSYQWNGIRYVMPQKHLCFWPFLETCISYALRILNAKLNALRCKVVCILLGVPTLRPCAARCKRARLQRLQNAPLGNPWLRASLGGKLREDAIAKCNSILGIVLGEHSLWGKAYAIPTTYKPRGAPRRVVFRQWE